MKLSLLMTELLFRKDLPIKNKDKGKILHTRYPVVYVRRLQSEFSFRHMHSQTSQKREYCSRISKDDDLLSSSSIFLTLCRNGSPHTDRYNLQLHFFQFSLLQILCLKSTNFLRIWDDGISWNQMFLIFWIWIQIFAKKSVH